MSIGTDIPSGPGQTTAAKSKSVVPASDSPIWPVSLDPTNAWPAGDAESNDIPLSSIKTRLMDWMGTVWQRLRVLADGSVVVTEQQAPGYEDGLAGVMKIEQRGTYLNITAATTTVVKSGPGFLYCLTINAPAASATITVYDSTTGSGTKLTTIVFPATLLSNGPIPLPINVAFATGLTIVTSGPTDLSISYR